MAPQKMVKAIGEGANLNADVLSDNTPRAIDTVKSWTRVFEILEHEIINCPEDSDDEVNDTHEAKLWDIAHSELHKIVERSRLMSYNDIIGWALENVNVQTRRILNSQKVVVGYFRPKHIQVMYKLSPDFKYNYNVAFMLEFEQHECIHYDKRYRDIIKSWWGHLEKFKADAHGIYAIASLDTHMIPKVEATTLEDVKLVDIKFKRHDPHKFVENHLAQYNLKRYVHENFPHDEIFRGVRSYEEVLNTFQTLSTDQ
jgi:hypothetical protein